MTEDTFRSLDRGSGQSPDPEITALLRAWRLGDREAEDDLVGRIYAELKRIAARELAHEESHSLQVTELVHEAYLRLASEPQPDWQNRHQFFAIATRIARRILVDHARKRKSRKRGGHRVRVGLDTVALIEAAPNLDLLALDAALDSLTELDPQASQVVELRYLGGLTIDETGAALGIARATVTHKWRMARAWLRGVLTEGLCAVEAGSSDHE